MHFWFAIAFQINTTLIMTKCMQLLQFPLSHTTKINYNGLVSMHYERILRNKNKSLQRKTRLFAIAEKKESAKMSRSQTATMLLITVLILLVQ